MLRDAIRTSKVKKMVLWLFRGRVDATDQLCQFLQCNRLQSIKVRRFDHPKTSLNLLQILIAINMQASRLRILYLEEWDFSQNAVVTVINTYLNDLCWFSSDLLTLRVNRETFEAFVWSFKNSTSTNHHVVEERSALQDSCTLSLCSIINENSPPEYQPDWISRIQNMQNSEGLMLRQRLKCHISAVNNDAEGIITTSNFEYRLSILRLITNKSSS